MNGLHTVFHAKHCNAEYLDKTLHSLAGRLQEQNEHEVELADLLRHSIECWNLSANAILAG